MLIGGDHSIGRCDEMTERTLHATFARIFEAGVDLEGVLKPNMVICGKDSPEQVGVEEVARRTVENLLRSLPAAVLGIVLLSGGQSNKQATAHLNAMNSLYPNLPWELSFSYARALQALVMKTWTGRGGQRRGRPESLLPPPQDERRRPCPGGYSEETEKAA